MLIKVRFQDQLYEMGNRRRLWFKIGQFNEWYVENITLSCLFYQKNSILKYFSSYHYLRNTRNLTLKGKQICVLKLYFKYLPISRIVSLALMAVNSQIVDERHNALMTSLPPKITTKICTILLEKGTSKDIYVQ